MDNIRNVITVAHDEKGNPIQYIRQPDGEFINAYSERGYWTEAEIVQHYCSCFDDPENCRVHLPTQEANMPTWDELQKNWKDE